MIASLVLAIVDAESIKNAAIGVVLLTACISTAAVLYPLTRAWARRLEGKGTDERSVAGIEELNARVNQLEDQVSRMHELEDRLDFAERMLVKGRLESGIDTPPEPVDAGR